MKKIILGLMMVSTISFGFQNDEFKSSYNNFGNGMSISISKKYTKHIQYVMILLDKYYSLNEFSKMINRDITFTKKGLPCYTQFNDNGLPTAIAFPILIDGRIDRIEILGLDENSNDYRKFYYDNYNEILKEINKLIN